MPLPLHLATVLTFAALITSVMTLGLALTAWRARQAHLWHWTGALVCVSLGLLLFGQRGQAPDAVSVVLANSILLGTPLLTLTGYHRLFGTRVPPAVRRGLVLACTAVLVFATLTPTDAFGLRFLVFNVFSVGLALLNAGTLWRHRVQIGLALLTLPLLAHGTLAGLSVARLLTLALDGAPPTSLQALGPAQVLFFMLTIVGLVALVFGFLSLHAGRLAQRLEAQAETDALTGLANRRGFERAVQQEWRRHRRQGTPLALLALDIDHFKRINDRHGHAAGDRALVHLAEQLRLRLRPYDLVARLGGEEFCVVLPDTPLDQALVTAERLRQTPCQVLDAAGTAQPFTLSIGVALAQTLDADPDAVLQRADHGLLKAKAQGRNRVVLADATEPAQTGAPHDRHDPHTLPSP